MFVDIANIFIQYLHTLDLDEIVHMDNDLKANSWGVRSVVEIEHALELLCIFQMFHHYNGRLLLKNSLLIVPNGETTLGSEELSLKSLYKMFKDTKSHGLVSLQFLGALNIFFWWRR